MQNALRKWLVGIGLMVALLALAVPALAQNQWMSQTTPATFPSPVQTMSLDAAGRLDIGTAGGGYPGGTLGQHYADPAWPADNFLGPDPALPAPVNDDLTAMLWDGAYLFAGTFDTNTTPANGGFYFWNGAVWTNPVLPAFVNKHAEAFAIDPTVAGVAGQPHMLYVGSWGDGVYTFDGATWTKLNFPGSFGVGAQFVHKLIVVPFTGVCGGVHTNLTVYAATDGYGVVKGVQNCATLAWTWTQDFTADLFVHSLAMDVSGNIVAGTRSMGAYMFNGVSWVPMASAVPFTSTINDVVSDGANGFFAGTAGQGVFRYDVTRNSWFQINTGYGVGFNLGDLYVNSVAWDGVNSYLYAGTGNLVPGSLGHVYRINLVPLVNCEPATRNVVAGTYDANPICLTPAATGNPKNWFAEVTTGSLPPGLALGMNNLPAIPAVDISGTPTQDCSWPFVVTVWDALLNRTDVPITYLVQLGVSFTINTTPAPLGTVTSFTSNVIGATGTLSYAWNFGDGAPLPAVDSTLANPTHIYTAPGSYPVTLWVSDSACPGGGGTLVCPATSPDACAVGTVDIYGPLTVDPNATIVGSGSQFQFHPTPFGSAMGGLPVCATPDGYTYDWRFYLGIAQDTSNELTWARSSLAEPVVTFTTTGAFWASVTVTDCSGHTAYGYCVFNYNGPMSATLSSNTNPADTLTPVVFNGTAVGQGAFANYGFWIDFGDGTSFPVQPPFPAPPVFAPPTTTVPVPTFIPLGHIYAAAGTYTVKLTAQDDPAFGHTTVMYYQQVIYPAFTGITVTRTDGCTFGYPGGHVAQTVLFHLTPVGGLPPYLLSVDWGDGSTQTVSGITGPFPYNIGHTYTTAGAYTATFYMTDSGHIPVTNSQTSGPFYLANITQGHITVNGGTCAEVVTPTATTIVLYNDTVLSTGFLATDYQYNLNFGDGTPVTGWVNFAAATATLFHNYTVPVGEITHTYTLSYQLYNTLTCEYAGPYTATVMAFNPLVPLAPPTWVQACGSRSVSFSAVAPTTGVPPYTYKWDFADGTLPYTTTGPSTTHVFAANGNYNCQLTVNDSYSANCGAVTVPNTVNTIYLVRVVEPISGTIAATSATSGCAPLSVSFTSAMAGGAIVAPLPPFQPNPALNYTWSTIPSAGVTYTPSNTVWNPTINFANPGVYTVTLSVTSTTVPYTCSSNSVTVTVYAGMTPGSMSFTQTETSGYLPLNDTFTTTWGLAGVPSSPVTLVYHWDDGTPDTTVNNAVSPDYTQHTFNIASGALGYLVSVTATDTCGNTQMFNRRIVILEPPVLGVTTSVTPTAGTAPFTAAFASLPTGGVSPYTFAWAFGDGGTSTAQNPTHIYAAAGVYTATLTVTDSYPAPNGPKTASASLTVTVYNTLTVNATGTPTNGSKPLTVNFSSTPTGGNGTYTYLWYFGDGGNSALQNPTHVFNTAGTYFAYVVVSDTASHTGTSNQVVITAYDPLTVTANAVPNTGTLPLGVNFSAQANGGDQNYSYAWTFGDGGTATGALVNHIYTTMPPSGYVFNASVTVTDGVGHTATVNVPVTVYQPLTASIAASATSGTIPLAVNFTSTVAGGNGAYTYLWNFGDGTTANTANPTKTYTTAGNYSVTLQVTDTASHTVLSNTINMTTWAPMTVASSATPTNIIVGQSITFTALAQGGNGIYTYTWTFGDSTTGTGATVNHMYAVGPRPSFTWTAHVVVTDTAGHSVTGADIVVTVRPVPPTILGAQKLVPPQVPSWRLKLIGTNFQNGITVTISGTPVVVTFKNGGEIILKDCKSLCPKGVAVPIVATNPDGGVSATFMYTRGPQP